MAMNVDAERPTNPHLRGIYPWGRYWAKMIDFYIYAFLMGYFTPDAVKVAVSQAGETLGWLALGAVVVPLMEAITISAFGTTIGKAAFRISIMRADGSKLSLGQAVRRSYLSWLHGAWLGVPILSLVPMWNAYKEYATAGVVSWDSKVEAKFSALRPAWWSWCLLAVSAGIQLMFAIVVYVVAAVRLAD
jgi:uncharacterized RDD family membrane protein YckC